MAMYDHIGLYMGHLYGHTFPCKDIYAHIWTTYHRICPYQAVYDDLCALYIEREREREYVHYIYIYI